MHQKQRHNVSVGDEVSCGSRKLRIDAVDGDVVDLTLTIKKGETVEVRDPRQRDNPWILDDPGEGTMVESSHSVTVGHKVRVGNHRQFRVLPGDNGNFEVVVVGPDNEV